MKDQQAKVVRTRWVICNKGDNVEYDVRARLDACEVNTYRTDEFYASTPPFEAKKVTMSEFAARREDNKSRIVGTRFVGIRKACFNGMPRMSVTSGYAVEVRFAYINEADLKVATLAVLPPCGKLRHQDLLCL